MLKKVLSAVLSLSIVGTMFAAVPASADSKDVVHTTTIINENFDGITLNKETPSGKPVNENLTLSADNWGNGAASVSTVANGNDESDKLLAVKIPGWLGFSAKFAPKEAVNMNQGDVLHINFDYKTGDYADDDAYVDFSVLLNAAAGSGQKARFTAIGDSFKGSGASAIVTKFLGKKGPSLGDLADKATWYIWNSKRQSEWLNCDIVINTADKAADNDQTIKATYKLPSGEQKVFYAKYDWNYTGDDDESYDKITSFDDLKLNYAWGENAKDVTAYFNNMKIEKISYGKEYYTTTVKNLIDYDFSTATSFNKTFIDNNNSLATVDAANNVYFRKSSLSAGKATGEVVKTAKDGKDVYAFAQTVGYRVTKADVLNYLVFKNPEGSTRLNKGDIIRFSYDLKHEAPAGNTNEWLYRFSPQINMPRYRYNYWSNYEESNEEVEYESTYLGTYHATGMAYNPEYTAGMLMPINAAGNTTYAGGATIEWGNGSNKNKTVTANEWHNYEYVINTADPAKEGKQTMKVYIDGELGYYATLDNKVGRNGAAASDEDSVDRYDHFTALEMNFLSNVANDTTKIGTIYSTNYKLDIIKPGFGISGDAIKDNDPTDEIKLNPGTMTVTCAVNMPGSTAAKSDVTVKDVTIYAAQYDGDQLVNVVSKKVKMSEYTNTTTLDVTVLGNANTVKLFAFDDDLTPLLVNEVGTVESINTQAINYSNSFEGAVG